ncbi:MAG: ABC transporter substrate-binding protein [Cyanobacteria bacterium J149]|nr:MAG: ABC transporter substrate-binding protein [Cyanobacteria bacterium J149]
MTIIKSFLFSITLCLYLVSSPLVKSAEWEEIQARGKIIVGVKDNLPPLGFTDQNGNLQGFEIDLAHKLAEELLGDKQAIKFVPLLNQDRLNAVIEDDVDIAIASITFNSSRQRLVDFSDIYYFSGTGIIVKKNRFLSNIRDISGKIGILSHSRAIAEIQYQFPQLSLQGVSSYQEALELMEKGEIQGFAGDVMVLTGITQQTSNYQLLPQIIGAYPIAIALPKGRQYQSLRNQVNQVMRKLRQEDWFKEKAKFWGLP